MKFGLFGGAVRRGETADSASYGDFINFVVAADKLDFASIFIVEHHFSGIGQVSASLSLLTYLAAKTEKIRLGTAVTILPWHNPILLAEQAATLDLLSGGRLDFGIGKGYRDLEFKGFCIPKEEAQERFDEALEIIFKAWTSSERFSYHSERWNFEDIIVEPEIVQKPMPPIWTGAGTPSSIQRVAKNGFNLLLDQYGSFDLTRERVDVFRQACDEVGRTYNPAEVGLTRAIVLTGSKKETAVAKEARAKRSGAMSKFGRLPGLPEEPQSYADGSAPVDDAAIIGEPGEVIERVMELREFGVEYVLTLATGTPESLNNFAEKIMPAFADEKQSLGSAAQ
ncbi:MAG: LLM class flavin-dependent oxidoreductase [Rhodospirillales bacterium]|nr:LLM class flavin-dependent oxidoreductase [Rhodospirillales bacterium]